MLERYGILLLAACIAGCDTPKRTIELTGAAMGTQYNLTIVVADDTPGKDALQAAVAALLEDIERRLSTYIDDSELSLLNAAGANEWLPVSGELCEALAGALDMARLTDGAFDVTVGPLVNLWGFGPDEIVLTPPSERDIASARMQVGYERIETDCEVPAVRKSDPGIYIDLSGYAKGYGVDRVAALLDREGIGNYLADIGGELRMRGENANGDRWRIAIEQPLDDARRVHSILRITNAAVATSGDYRNFFIHDGRRYSHTIDPRTGYPVRHNAASVTVVATTAAYADAMATGLLVLGVEDGLRLAREKGIAALFLTREGDRFESVASPAYASLGGP